MLLVQCQPTSQWLYERMQPILADGSPYGYLNLFDTELAAKFGISRSTVTQALHDLRNHGIMRRSCDGSWYSPHLIASMVRRCVR